MEKEQKVVDFVDNAEDFELPLLGTLEGQILILESAKFDSSSYGAYAVIGLTIESQAKAGTQYFRSSGTAILNQLERIKENAFEKGLTMRVKLVKPKGKKYFVFVPPK